VVFDPTPTPALAFGDPRNHADWTLAWEGQWFIGVLDTQHKRVYVLPISPRSQDALANTGDRNRNRYASGPEAQGLPQRQWTSCPVNWLSEGQGATTHHKCLNRYQLAEGDCLGFTIIKVDREGTFALIKLTSNSLNQKPDTAGPSHSFSRATAKAEDRMPRYDNPSSARDGLPYNDPHKPGKARFEPGTYCMGHGWASALEQFLKTQGIRNIALSMD